MEEFKSQVKKSFQACKSDIQEIRDENSKLKDHINTLEQANSNLYNEIKDLKSEIKGLTIAIEHIKELSLSKSNDNNSEKQSSVEMESDTNVPQQKPIQEEIIPNKPEKTKKEDPYEALLAFKAKTNKRELLKQKMISMVGENGMNLSELKFMFVEHFKYTSKATFYNYLKELELERNIKVERENGKNYVYLFTMRKEV